MLRARSLIRMRALSLGDAVVGDVFSRQGRYVQVVKVVGNVKQGKGKSQSMIIVRDLLSGAKKEIRVKSESIDIVELSIVPGNVVAVDERKKTVTLELESGEQVTAPVTDSGHAFLYFSPGASALLRLVDEKPLDLKVPKHALAKVESVPPRAERATDSKSVAILENGRRIKVPGHVEPGQWIVVRPSDETYVRTADPDDLENLEQDEDED